MKKLIALLLAAIMVLSLAACASSPAADQPANDQTTADTTTEETKTEEKTEDTAASGDVEVVTYYCSPAAPQSGSTKMLPSSARSCVRTSPQ